LKQFGKFEGQAQVGQRRIYYIYYTFILDNNICIIYRPWHLSCKQIAHEKPTLQQHRRTARETTTPGPAVDRFSRQRFRRYCTLKPRAHRRGRACVKCLLTITYYRVTAGARVYKMNPDLLWWCLMCGLVCASSVNRRKSYGFLAFVFIYFFSSSRTFHRIPEYNMIL